MIVPVIEERQEKDVGRVLTPISRVKEKGPDLLVEART
jgi:hypothetical protein